MGEAIDAWVDKVDDFQRRHRITAFAFGVVKRFSDDRGSQYSALLAYYGFFSLLPILLVITTIAATILDDDVETQQKIVTSITDHVPVTGTAVAENVHTLSGSGIALVIGILATAYGALGAMNAAQDAFNTMWGVPRFKWPNIFLRGARSLAVISIVGVAFILAAIATSLLAAVDIPVGGRILGLAITILLNGFALLLGFEMLVNTRIGLRTLLPGALTGGFGLVVLQYAGAWYLTAVVNRLNAFYGIFATAMGLLIWIGLQARVVLLAGEVNVVLDRKLFPRSLTGRRLGPPDRAALADVIARESLTEELIIDAAIPD